MNSLCPMPASLFIFMQVFVQFTVVTCGSLSLTNGRVSYNKSPVNGRYPVVTKASFSCNDGYKIDGLSSRACLITGNWYGETPKCNKEGGGCFPATAKTKLEGGRSVTMSQLKVGDTVQTVSSNGMVIYSEITSFLKKQPNRIAKYKSISTENETLTLTGNHLVYTRKDFMDPFFPVFADQLSVGDEILVQRSNNLSPAMVINVDNITMQGAYVPLTAEGNIMVDGVLASCYADFPQYLAHLVMTPMQKYSRVMERIFGDDTGFPVFISTAMNLGKDILPYGQFLIY